MSVPGPGSGGGPGPQPPVVDADIGARSPRSRRDWTRHRTVLPVIALGGVLGAVARHGAALAWPTPAGGVPWTTLTVNAGGCLVIGVLMVLVVEVGGTHPLLRPFVGVGVLGGFTTFSTYAVEADGLLVAGRPVAALGYVLGTVVAALLAVTAGVWLGRGGTRTRRWLLTRRGGRT